MADHRSSRRHEAPRLLYGPILADALAILDTQPAYRDAGPVARCVRDAAKTGKLHLICDGLAFFTWFRPAYPPDGVPDAREWREHGPLAWIVDVVACPGVQPMKIGREISRIMVQTGAAKVGERVAFWRWPVGRVGFITMQEVRA